MSVCPWLVNEFFELVQSQKSLGSMLMHESITDLGVSLQVIGISLAFDFDVTDSWWSRVILNVPDRSKICGRALSSVWVRVCPYMSRRLTCSHTKSLYRIWNISQQQRCRGYFMTIFISHRSIRPMGRRLRIRDCFLSPTVVTASQYGRHSRCSLWLPSFLSFSFPSYVCCTSCRCLIYFKESVYKTVKHSKSLPPTDDFVEKCVA